MNRVWIYQAEKSLSSDEKTIIENYLKEFVPRWQAHGHPLKATYEIYEDLFVLIYVDESFEAVSGCATDESVKLMQHISKETGIDFFNRQMMAYRNNEGNVNLIPLSKIASAYTEGLISDSTQVYDNTLINAEELTSKWRKPLKESGFRNFI